MFGAFENEWTNLQASMPLSCQIKPVEKQWSRGDYLQKVVTASLEVLLNPHLQDGVKTTFTLVPLLPFPAVGFGI